MINKYKLLGRMAEAGFSQRRLAREMGVSKNTINAKINGRTAFDTHEIQELCEILHIVDPIDKVDIFLPQSSQIRD